VRSSASAIRNRLVEHGLGEQFCRNRDGVIEDIVELEAVLQAERDDAGFFIGGGLSSKPKPRRSACAARGPSAVDAATERGWSTICMPPLFVEEALEHHALFVWDCSEASAAFGDIVGDLLGGFVRGRLISSSSASGSVSSSRSSPISEDSSPWRDGLRLARMESWAVVLGVGDAHDAALDFRMRQEVLPSWKMSPTFDFDCEIFIERADDVPSGSWRTLIIGYIGDLRHRR